MYGEDFDILETKEGIVIAAENEPGEFTFSWELKSTIKSIDYDPLKQTTMMKKLQTKLKRNYVKNKKRLLKLSN